MDADSKIGRELIERLTDGNPERRPPFPSFRWIMDGYTPTSHRAPEPTNAQEALQKENH